ncbi:MAG: phage portal protein [Candidatus Bathyarchaeia archaeon]
MPRGGGRPGAGRPRKPKDAPLSLSAPADRRPTLHLSEALAGKGLVVLSTAAAPPSGEKRGGESLEAGPKSRYAPWTYRTTSASYSGMNRYYREYRRDSLVRGCIDVLASFATGKGFDAYAEPVDPGESAEKYADLVAYVNEVNRRVNMDEVLRRAVIKAKIYGKAAFEIVRDEKTGEPLELLPLDSTRIQPEIDEETWRLKSFSYGGVSGFYQPGEVLYFANNALEADLEGLSDVEPVLDALETRRILLGEALKEAARVLWAGIGIHQVDTSGLSDEEAQAALEAHVQQIKPGKHIVTNQKIQVQIADLKPDLEKLIAELEYLDQEIIGSFRVPRFLVGREKQFNRATAYAELEAFVNGPVADIQRWLRREVERQWYTPLARLYLGLGEEDPLPVKVKHKWNPISTADYVELAEAVAKLYGQGLGVLTRRKAYEMLGFDPSELEAGEEGEKGG